MNAIATPFGDQLLHQNDNAPIELAVNPLPCMSPATPVSWLSNESPTQTVVHQVLGSVGLAVEICHLTAWANNVRASYHRPMKQHLASVSYVVAVLRSAVSVFSLSYISSAVALAYVLHIGLEQLGR